jgi:hypothetical protein
MAGPQDNPERLWMHRVRRVGVVTEAPPARSGRRAETAFRRLEEKLRLPPEEALALYGALAPRARPDEFLPGQPVTQVTTIYCDGPELPLYREARAGGARTRVRIRTYLYPAPAVPDPFCWIEWKSSPPRGDGGYTTKRRFRLPSAALPGLFSGRLSPDLIRALQTSAKAGAEAVACYQSFLAASHRLRLAPVAATTYLRRGLLLESGPDRITFDFGLSYAPVGPDLALGPATPDPLAVVEVKRATALPPWAAEALAPCLAAAAPFSKFERAMEAVLARRR